MALCCTKRDTSRPVLHTNRVGESTNRLPIRARMATRSTYSGTRQQVRRDLWLAVALTFVCALAWYASEIKNELRATFTRHAEYVYSMAARCEHADPGTVPLWWGPDGKRHDGRPLLANERRCGRV